MASTHDISGTYSAPPFQQKVSVLKIKIDSSDTTQFPAGIIQNATVTLYDIPAGWTILAAQLYVETAQADISDVDLGIHASGTTDAQLVDGATMATTGYKFTAGLAAALPVTAASALVFTNKDAQTLETGVVYAIVTIADTTV